MTTAFNRWVPFCGANNKEKAEELSPTGELDQYVWRASYLPAMNVDSQFVQDPDQDFDILRTGLREWKRLAPYMLKDFYVLTPWHTREDKTSFTAYCYFDPESGEGALLAFRQERCQAEEVQLTLPFAREEGCCLTDEDSGETLRVSGDEMRGKGFALSFDAPRSARLLWVRIEK